MYGLTAFAIYLIVTFAAFDESFLIFAIVYTILAFLAAVLSDYIRSLINNNQNGCSCNSNDSCNCNNDNSCNRNIEDSDIYNNLNGCNSNRNNMTNVENEYTFCHNSRLQRRRL